MFRSLLLFLLLLSSCIPESEDLSAPELERVDTLYSNEVEALRPLLDSLCMLQEDSLIIRAVDSILKVREGEMEQILNR